MVFASKRYAVKNRGTYYDQPRRAGMFLSRGPNKRAGSSFTRWSAPRSQLKRPAQKEVGYVDVASAAYPLDTTGSITLLNIVPQGASISQRVGKKIQLKSLQCRGYAYQGTTALINDIAYMVVYDKRPCGSMPAITDILESVSPAAFNNTQNEGRFRVLKRVDFAMTGNTATAGQQTETSVVSMDFFLDLKGLPTTFKAAGTGAIADQEDGALYFVTVGRTAAGTSAAGLDCGFRLRYWDV